MLYFRTCLYLITVTTDKTTHPTILYVIGNGFDLWHGIPSSLRDFKTNVLNTDSDIHRDVEEYLPAGEDWCDLECSLAELDADMLSNNLGHFMSAYGDADWSDSGHHDFQYEVEQVVERLSARLRKLFGTWIRSLQIPTAISAVRRLSLDPQAQYLTFNYTSTLHKVYGIAQRQVLHIHGCADDPDQNLVLGHAWAPESRRSLNDREDIEELDSRLAEANNIIDDYFSATFKPSKELIAQNRLFFDMLTNTERVLVLGHSLSTVDEVYFRALLRQPSVAASQWVVACRRIEEWPEKEARLIDMGLRRGGAVPISWDAL
ncbi:bacteriophage abortive infection AbiH family protein [Herbaspirillum sp. alder98]|uniref:bacteriophage abortive infection AbiH family protein n=1 Tax=Herbaspirillum sp. alder98 TaxID=2913096 RepID=UPI001CD8DB57|nr:bacteriophage abortive infection AbiH family protein [Herbaspirillum sp. alder98]MCA1325146.1 bacteriophage abortive infection AbiH family protein [Herbaspirillum sp. alder98]